MQRRRYFRAHRSRIDRERFVQRQKAKLRSLQRAASCRVPPVPLPPPPLPPPPPLLPPPPPAPGVSFQAVYALASDQASNPNLSTAIENEVNVVNAWFATQTIGGVQPRWIRTADRRVSVTTVRLRHTAAEYGAAFSAHTLVSEDLVTAMPAGPPPGEYAVWIDVTSPGICGISGFNSVLVIFMAQCNIYPGITDYWPYGGSYLLAHEMTHAFGAVSACAPHFDGGGHVNDDPRDVLYQGPLSRDWTHLMLDPGHDDYYATGRTDCPGIETSELWLEPESG
jgi:hypothetical protein